MTSSEKTKDDWKDKETMEDLFKKRLSEEEHKLIKSIIIGYGLLCAKHGREQGKKDKLLTMKTLLKKLEQELEKG